MQLLTRTSVKRVNLGNHFHDVGPKTIAVVAVQQVTRGMDVSSVRNNRSIVYPRVDFHLKLVPVIEHQVLLVFRLRPSHSH
jgi:hypothetical protein